MSGSWYYNSYILTYIPSVGVVSPLKLRITGMNALLSAAHVLNNYILCHSSMDIPPMTHVCIVQ